MLKCFAAALAVILYASPALAQEFTPGRPGATESPIAVPRGHWQVETEIASFAHDDDSDTDTIGAFETTFRYGVAPGWDAELIVSPYTHVDAGGEDDSGAGDLTLRLRKTFAGLDGGPSFGLIGYVTLPTGEDGFGAEDVEGGLDAAGGFNLSDTWALTWTAGVGAVSADEDEYDTAVSGGVAFGHGLSARLGYYVEAFAEHVDDDTAATANFGVTYLWDAVTQIDANIDIGVTDAADDARLSIGWAHLF
jgi:hypothetical protein